MGFSDRDYLREEPYDDTGYRRKQTSAPMSITMRLIILNFVIWIVNGFLFPEDNRLSQLLACNVNSLCEPWRWWELLTYGFAHSPNDFFHIGGNMFALVMFGYGMMLGIGPNGFGLMRGGNVEERLGRLEYLAFYLTTIILGGIVFGLVHWNAPRAFAWGASGGITGVIILFALFFPNKTIMMMGIIPMPMWVLGVLIVFMDAYGQGYGQQGIAYSIHLAGAGFALFYYYVFYQKRRKLMDFFGLPGKWFKQRQRPTLKIYPEDKPKKGREDKKDEEEAKFQQRLDDILKRYGQVGDSGLTAEERAFLQQASKKYRDKK